MARSNPTVWLARRAKSGLQDMPSNAAWMLRTALQPPDTAKDAARSVKDKTVSAVVSATEHLPGDSVEARTQQARDAAADAQAAEADAITAAQAAKAQSEEAGRVVETAKVRIKETQKQTRASVEQRVRAARERADAMVEQERAAAEADAESVVQQARADAEADARDSEQRAKQTHDDAEAKIAKANEVLARARELADAAAEAAQEAAQEARREADRLAGRAEEQAQEADHRVEEASAVRSHTAAVAASTTVHLNGTDVDEDLKDLDKKQLLELAANLEIAGRSAMSKDELVKRLKTTSRSKSTSK